MPTLRNIGSNQRFRDALSSARDFREARYQQAQELKEKWHGWLYKNPPNIPLLVSNVIYLALCLTVLTLTVLIMHEHADDFKRNTLSRFRDPAKAGTPTELQPKPCGMPTPDGMYLLQALGALPAAGWDGAATGRVVGAWDADTNGKLSTGELGAALSDVDARLSLHSLDPGDGSWLNFGTLWNALIAGLILFFVYTVVEAMARAKQAELDEATLAKKK